MAPTGSGKTLAAFLWAVDRLVATPPPADKLRRCRVLYVSPLKALAVDIERNLRAPLIGIQHAATRLGLPVPDIRVGVRSGDTTAEERRRIATTPPDILITTPESLFLLLTSRAREALRGVETVIVDEVHAVAGTKRGAHLAVSLERLDALLERPAQRVGLSATVRPVEQVARFLGGEHPVDVVQPPASKTLEIAVEVTVEDMTAIGEQTGPSVLSDMPVLDWSNIDRRTTGPDAESDRRSEASRDAAVGPWCRRRSPAGPEFEPSRRGPVRAARARRLGDGRRDREPHLHLALDRTPGARTGSGALVHDRLRQLPAPRRTALQPAERTRRGRRRPRTPGPDDAGPAAGGAPGQGGSGGPTPSRARPRSPGRTTAA